MWTRPENHLFIQFVVILDLPPKFAVEVHFMMNFILLIIIKTHVCVVIVIKYRSSHFDITGERTNF